MDKFLKDHSQKEIKEIISDIENRIDVTDEEFLDIDLSLAELESITIFFHWKQSQIQKKRKDLVERIVFWKNLLI